MREPLPAGLTLRRRPHDFGPFRALKKPGAEDTPDDND